MSAVNRTIIPVHETASLQAGELSLKRSIRFHAYVRVQQLAIDLVAIFNRSNSGEFRTEGAKLQGIKGKKSLHGAHNSLNAGILDNVLQQAKENLLKSGDMTPKTKGTIRHVYGWSPATAREKIVQDEASISLEDSLLWSKVKKERHHCVVLPSWVNLTVDGKMEKIFRPIAEKYYRQALTGEKNVEEILKEIVPQIEIYFIKASQNCEYMADTLKKITRAEKEFLKLAQYSNDCSHLKSSVCRKALELLYTINELNQQILHGKKGAPGTKNIPTVLGKVVKKLPKTKPKKTKMIRALVTAKFAMLKEANKTHLDLKKSIWKSRIEKIKHYKNLSYGNKQSAKGTKIPPLDYLFLENDDEIIAFSNRVIRKPGLPTPSPLSTTRKENIPTQRRPIKKTVIKHLLFT